MNTALFNYMIAFLSQLDASGLDWLIVVCAGTVSAEIDNGYIVEDVGCDAEVCEAKCPWSRVFVVHVSSRDLVRRDGRPPHILPYPRRQRSSPSWGCHALQLLHRACLRDANQVIVRVRLRAWKRERFADGRLGVHHYMHSLCNVGYMNGLDLCISMIDAEDDGRC